MPFILEKELCRIRHQVSSSREEDPFDAVWKEDRPKVSFSPIFEHKISPRSVKDKIGILKPLVEKEGAQKALAHQSGRHCVADKSERQ